METGNPKLTKLRILAERAKKEQLAAEDIAFEKRRRYEELWTAYARAVRETGYCPSCEKTLKDCECLVIGSRADLKYGHWHQELPKA